MFGFFLLPALNAGFLLMDKKDWINFKFCFDKTSPSFALYNWKKDFVREYCTGLKDKNGKLVFEGDVLTSDNYPFKDNGVRNYDAEVVWFINVPEFGIVLHCVNKNKRGISDLISEQIEDSERFEIIGNIHEQ